MPKRKKTGSNYTSKGERRNVKKSILKAVRRDRSVIDRVFFLLGIIYILI